MNRNSNAGFPAPGELEGLIAALGEHISARRLAKIKEVAARRTRYLTVVLSGIYYTQNISAVVRSCECLGIQDVYITGTTPSTKINKHVAIGAANWVDIHRRNGLPPEELLKDLQQQGYRLVAAVPEESAPSLYDFDLQAGKVALIMGNEMEGLHSGILQGATAQIAIPMRGFSDSLNISVSAAIILSELIHRLQCSDLPWQLSGHEILELEYRWIKATLSRGEEISRQYRWQLFHPNDQIPEQN